MAVEAGGIGARLRAGREKHALTVLQVAERMHTDPRVIEAIEAESFESLGAPVYARGHIRHYAELVGESGSELVGLYSDRARIAEPDLTRIVKAPASSDSSKLVAPALFMIAVFAVAGAGWWLSSLSKKKPQLSDTHVVGQEAPASASRPATEPPPTAGGAQEQITAPQAPEQGPGQASGVARAPTASGSMAPRSAAATLPPTSRSATAGPAPPQPRSATATLVPTPARSATVSSATASSAAASSGTAGSAAARPAPAAPAAAGAASPPRPRNQAQVTLRYAADSWTEVYDASGTRLFYDVGAANSVQTLVGTPPLRVVLGNASGVAVEFNGQTKPIGKLSQPDGSAQFSINRSGQVVRAKPVADGG